MKILHTSDWHIGRTLYGRERYDEFEAFLTRLAETIQQSAGAVHYSDRRPGGPYDR